MSNFRKNLTISPMFWSIFCHQAFLGEGLPRPCPGWQGKILLLSACQACMVGSQEFADSRLVLGTAISKEVWGLVAFGFVSHSQISTAVLNQLKQGFRLAAESWSWSRDWVIVDHFSKCISNLQFLMKDYGKRTWLILAHFGAQGHSFLLVLKKPGWSCQ